jgi:[ribosomal protein S18]-alanine N-acetyltransferase
MTFHVRPLKRRDLPDVLAIERASFASPWRETDFDATLRLKHVFGLAAEIEGELCGYLLGETEGRRILVLNLCVEHGARRRGIATALIRAVTRQLRTGHRLVTIVGERNLAAQLFYRSQGFRAVTILRRLYDGTHDDAYLFEHRSGEGAAPFLPANRVAAYLH